MTAVTCRHADEFTKGRCALPGQPRRGAFMVRFPDDAACLDYLDWLRWPDGFRCTHCGSEKGWRLPAGGWSCGGCRRRVRVLAGTVFQDTRTPLTVWFEAAWLMAVTKNGVSAASLQPLLGLGMLLWMSSESKSLLCGLAGGAQHSADGGPGDVVLAGTEDG